MAVKLTPAVFLLYLLWQRRFADAGRCALTFLAVSMAAFVVTPRVSVDYWSSQLFSGSGLGDVSSVRNHSLNGLLERWLPGLAPALWPVLGAVTLVGGLSIAKKVSRLGGEICALGLIGITGCLVSPVSWSHHWVWFIPAFAGMLGPLFRRTAWSNIWLWLAVGFLAGVDFAPGEFMLHNSVARAINTNAYLVISLGTLAICYFRCRPPRSRAPLGGIWWRGPVFGRRRVGLAGADSAR